jgi:hypothetical protein
VRLFIFGGIATPVNRDCVTLSPSCDPEYSVQHGRERPSGSHFYFLEMRMLRKAAMMFVGTLALVLVLGTATADEKKTPSISTIMKAVAGNKTEKGLCGKCLAAGKEEKWDDAQKLAKSLCECVANLPKNKCPKGDADSWEKLSKKFADQAKVIEKAATDKDSKAFTEAVGTFTKSCGACHSAHKGKR